MQLRLATATVEHRGLTAGLSGLVAQVQPTFHALDAVCIARGHVDVVALLQGEVVHRPFQKPNLRTTRERSQHRVLLAHQVERLINFIATHAQLRIHLWLEHRELAVVAVLGLLAKQVQGILATDFQGAHRAASFSAMRASSTTAVLNA
ncbi:hypothetical protein D3C87_1683870 [compost metagenome]